MRVGHGPIQEPLEPTSGDRGQLDGRDFGGGSAADLSAAGLLEDVPGSGNLSTAPLPGGEVELPFRFDVDQDELIGHGPMMAMGCDSADSHGFLHSRLRSVTLEQLCSAMA